MIFVIIFVEVFISSISFRKFQGYSSKIFLKKSKEILDIFLEDLFERMKKL
jgi:hypothetical protein